MFCDIQLPSSLTSSEPVTHVILSFGIHLRKILSLNGYGNLDDDDDGDYE